MVCERRCIPSHTFRLLPTRQSETIPRCLIAALHGQAIPDGPHAEQQGHSVPARAESRSLKKDADKHAFHSFFTSVEIAEGFLFSPMTTGTQTGRERETPNPWEKFLERVKSRVSTNTYM